MNTIIALKAELTKNKATWVVKDTLHDTNEIPKFHLGAITDKLILAKTIAKVDLKKLGLATLNPFITARRVANNLIAKDITLLKGSTQILEAGQGAPAAGGGTPTVVDWRNRWGWPWITSIRDQAGCEACWVFASVALVEAMLRIEHCVFPKLSEGDVHKGLKATCCQCGEPETALNWIQANGVADPGCFPWSSESSKCSCSGCGGTGGGPYDAISYTPTADRTGRTTKIPAYTTVGDVTAQKSWLDNVGPLVVSFTVWDDFFSYGSGVYKVSSTLGPNVPNQKAGGHVVLIVGYDDTQSCWIAKNSWGTGWGMSGYFMIGYGEADIDSWGKLGLTGINPDPWTKRRIHNGSMLESGDGANHQNFELLSQASGNQVRHWWRDNSASGFPWHQAELFANDSAGPPTFISTTYNRNFECIFQTTGQRLHHWYYDQSSNKWIDGGIFGPTNVAGVPGFIQGNYGAPGNFEVVVRTSDNQLTHCWRDGAGWHVGVKFGSNILHSGASLLQSNYGQQGNFEVVAVNAAGQMQHFWRNNDSGLGWAAGVTFGSTVASAPCMIEGQFGAKDENSPGNFELCVAVQGKVQHWYRANNGDGLWRNSATFGHDVVAVVSLVESSFGFNLEVIVQRTDNNLQHYWRDGNGWHEGQTIGQI